MPSRILPLADLKVQHRLLAKEINRAIRGVLRRTDFILGSAVGEFEEAFARWIGVRHAVSVANGLDALRLSLEGLGIGPGDEVLVPANTYIATALAVSAVGGRPVLVDCDAGTYAIDAGHAEAAITRRTKALIPVHLGGQPADMRAILAIAQRHHLRVIEDAAQAHGAAYQGRFCGSMGAAGCFSFYPSKNLGACGDGGLITTNDSALAGRLRMLRNYGQPRKYEHVVKGWNSHLDTLQAAILKVKLKHLTAWTAARISHAKKLRGLLRGVGDLEFQQSLPGSTHAYHLFMVETSRRNALADHLARRGIQTVIHYPKPIHLQKAYAELRHRKGAFPNAERLARRTLSLPMFPELTDAQIRRVAAEVRSFFD